MDDFEILSGRPEKDTREPMEEACYDFLDNLGIEYSRVDHEALYTMEALLPVEAALACGVAKNLFLTNRQQTEFYLLLMPGDKPFKTKYLSAQLGCSRLSFGSEEQLLHYIGTTHGSASVLGLLNDRDHAVHLIADSDLKNAEWFACHPCRNTSTLRFWSGDLTEKVLPALGYDITWVTLPRETEQE